MNRRCGMEESVEAGTHRAAFLLYLATCES
jgi:hypothetical protein